MPITIKPTQLKYKDPSTSQYVSVVAATNGSGSSDVDVQINGTSILSNGVANIPIAGIGSLGTVKPNGLGISVNNSGDLSINKATSEQIKSSTANFNPIVPSTIHEATFYGLAKAAGVNLANETVTVGTYPASSKTAIKSMIGVNVDDVQINGTSIVSNGVANIPLATASTPGTVIAGNGLEVNSSTQKLQVKIASDATIKAGTNGNHFAAVGSQEKSTFYGLAKAAGDSTQSASSNAVGVYTDNAKAQIQKMIGNYEPDYVLVNDITLTEETSIELTADDNGTPYNFRNVFISLTYPANTPTASTGYGRYGFYDSNNYSVVAETGRFTTTTNNQYRLILIERKANLTFANFTTRSTTGGSGYWSTKPYGSANGVSNVVKNIIKIAMVGGDVEPAGTNIKIFAQWAY